VFGPALTRLFRPVPRRADWSIGTPAVFLFSLSG